MGQPGQPAVAEQPGARVTDVDQGQPVGTGQDQGGHGAAGDRRGGFRGRTGRPGAVPTLLHGPHHLVEGAEHVARVAVASTGHRLQHPRAHRVPVRAETVGDGGEPLVTGGPVLLPLPDRSSRRRGGAPQSQRRRLFARRGHVVLLVECLDEGGDEHAALDTGHLLTRPPVPHHGRELAGRSMRAGPDPGQRHTDPAQPGDPPRELELCRRVVAVAGRRVGTGGLQQAELVVEPQRLAGQPGDAGERAGRELVHLASSSPGTAPGPTTVGSAPGAGSRAPLHADTGDPESGPGAPLR